MNKICIQPLGDVSEEVLEFIRRGVEETFKLSCIVSNIKLNVPGKAFNSSRRQYYSSYILSYLLELSELMEFKRVLGVVDVDLYVPGLNFVFGEAILNGRASVISLFRLKPEFYGEIGGKNILLERALKEALHELGHTFGLNHCGNRECVMCFSNSIHDTDRKKGEFCPKCLERLSHLLMNP